MNYYLLYRFTNLCNAGNIKIKSIYTKANAFRHIQVLVGMLNAFQKGPLMLMITFMPILGQSLATPMLVRNSGVEVSLLTTLLFILLNCFMATLVILSQMGMLHKNSRKILEFMTWKQITLNLSKIQTRNTKWEHRFYRSCPPVKIMIASGSFVDMLTPLNCLQFGMSLSSNVLLLTANG